MTIREQTSGSEPQSDMDRGHDNKAREKGPNGRLGPAVCLKRPTSDPITEESVSNSSNKKPAPSRDGQDSSRKLLIKEQRVKEYEELDGGKGREVFFRPERYTAGDFSSVKPVVSIRSSRGDAICSLHDLSQNGIAFNYPGDSPFSPDDAIERLIVSFDGNQVYNGSARVISVRSEGKDSVVGASFIDSLMNIEDVLLLRDVKAWAPVEESGLKLIGQPWFAQGNETFKSRIAEMKLFIDNAEENYNDMEKSLPWHVIHGSTDSQARSGLMARIETEFVSYFLELMCQIDEALRTASAEDWHKLKEFSLRFLHDKFMRAPLLHQTHFKPLGYPGDYISMEHMYSKPFEGQSLFGKALHMGSCASLPAQAVRARKDLIRDQVFELVNSWKMNRPIRVCSIASGPAQETFELLSKELPSSVPLEIVLFDQDKRALSFAHNRIEPLSEKRANSHVRITYLHDSIKRLLTDASIFGDLGPFDLIFSSGLFDYLRLPTAVTLTGNFYKNLASKGRILIGNMDPGNPARWMFEHHLDWFLLYRTQEEMVAFARKAVPEAEIHIVEDDTGINPFVVIRKD